MKLSNYAKKPYFMEQKTVMNPIHYLLPLFLSLLVIPSYTTAEPPLPAYSKAYDSARDPIADGIEALKLARDTNRLVLIEVGGDWCRWCLVLDHFLKKYPALNQQLHNTFVLLKVNVEDSNSHPKFFKPFPSAKGYPHMYITDNKGSILHSQDTAQFLHKGKYSVKQFTAFIEHWSKYNAQHP